MLRNFVTTANLNDREGLFGILDGLDQTEFPLLQKIWADMGYQGDDAKSYVLSHGIDLEIVKRNSPSFQVQPRRWVVERTIAWINRNRRLSKDYEYRTSSSESMIYIAMSRLMLKRIIKLDKTL